MAHWKSNMPRLMKRVEFETGDKTWTQERISELAGIRQPTISEWMRPGEFKRLDGAVVQKLLAFFNRFFVCDLNDLVSWVNVEGEDNEEGNPAGLLVGVH